MFVQEAFLCVIWHNNCNIDGFLGCTRKKMISNPLIMSFQNEIVKSNLKCIKLIYNWLKSSWVHNSIIIIADLSETYRRPIGDQSETNRRPIGDPSETYWRHIGDPSETDMPQYIIQYTYINEQKVYKIRIFKYIFVEVPIRLRRHVDLRWVSDHAGRSLMGHVCLWWVSDQACQSLMGHVSLRWSMLRSPIRHVCLLSVSDRSPMGLR